MLAQGRHDATCLRKRLTLSLSLSYVQCFRICSKTAATRTCENIWPAMDEYSLHLAALQTIHLDIFAREKARRDLVRCVYFALKTFSFFLFSFFFFNLVVQTETMLFRNLLCRRLKLERPSVMKLLVCMACRGIIMLSACVCACVRACVRAWRARVCVCVRETELVCLCARARVCVCARARAHDREE